MGLRSVNALTLKRGNRTLKMPFIGSLCCGIYRDCFMNLKIQIIIAWNAFPSFKELKVDFVLDFFPEKRRKVAVEKYYFSST